ncbi:MAG: GNAT family N-acetyltransferase [Bacteroides sp.]|nr:GNAT family N-acetyltransferase [Bacteroides sp.]
MKNILTDRLIIRLAKPDDAQAIYQYRSDAIENQYQGWFPESAEEVRNYITNMPVSLDVADVCFQFAILTKNENHLIGDMGIVFTGHERMQAEVGCTLNKDFQGKGYATEALTAMVNYLFVALKKHRVVASIDPRNTSSIRLIERLGFRKEAHFKESYFLRGEWVDDIIYAMLDKDWSNR